MFEVKACGVKTHNVELFYHPSTANMSKVQPLASRLCSQLQ